MTAPRLRPGPRFAHAARVAAVVATLVAVLYVGVTVVFDVVDGRHLTDQVDVRVSDRLGDVIGPGRLGARGHLRLPPDNDVDDAPIVFWRVNANGKAIALTGGTPLLPARSWSSPGQPTTAVLGNDQFRLIAAPFGTGWLVAGQSLAQARHVEAVVERAEVIAGPAFVLVMFFGALAIGLLASRPVEQARRRQLEFTADASHELRTPLTVIEAEVDLALSSPRDGISYRGTLRRVGAEGKRLRRIVEDLLFLARFDANPPVPGDEPVDLRTIAEGCVQRFSAVAEARGIDLSIRSEGADAILVKAPPAWVDRLCGVLVDNACRYAGNGGSVRVLVAARANSVGIAVEDSGPGIPPEQRALLFDRFHRGTEEGDGAGLGLAIADAVVRSTGGKWRVADAPSGGAHMEVIWRRFYPRDDAADRDQKHRADTHRSEPEEVSLLQG